VRDGALFSPQKKERNETYKNGERSNDQEWPVHDSLPPYLLRHCLASNTVSCNQNAKKSISAAYLIIGRKFIDLLKETEKENIPFSA
jgi:hypothetical protein